MIPKTLLDHYRHVGSKFNRWFHNLHLNISSLSMGIVEIRKATLEV